MAKKVTTFKIDGYHCHRCVLCGLRYSDGCSDPWVNARCRDCAGQLYGRSIVDHNADPQPCCRTNVCRPCTTEQRKSCRLAGDTSWWICPVCCRTHPYQPSSRDKESR